MLEPHGGLGQWILDHTIPSHTWDQKDARIAVTVLEAVKKYQVDTLKAAERGNPGVILATYSSGGTSGLVSRHVSAPLATSSGSTEHVRRVGRENMEVCVEKAFFLINGKTHYLFREASFMTLGKKAWNYYTAWRRFLPTLKELGARGPNTTVYIFDRLMFGAMFKKIVRKHRAIAKALPEFEQRAKQWLLDFQLAGPCFIHDCANALKWSLHWSLSNPEGDMHDFYIAVEAVRNSFGRIAEELPGFIVRRLEFAPPDPNLDHFLCYQYWCIMGADSARAEVLAKMELKFDGDVLWCSSVYEGREDNVATIKGLIMHVFLFRRHTHSRWCTVCVSCRHITAGADLGLLALGEEILDSRGDTGQGDGSDDYYLGGLRKLIDNWELRRYMAIASIAGYVSESIMYEAMDDDRLVRRVSEFHAIIAEEVEFVSCVSEFTWRRLAVVVHEDSITWQDLRSQGNYSAHLGAAFMSWRFLKPMECYPWKLGVASDPAAELEELYRLPAEVVTDETATKLKIIREEGVIPPEQAVETVTSWKEVGFSSLVTECGHNNWSVIRRYHKMLAREMVQLRSGIQILKPLAPAPSAAECRLERGARGEATRQAACEATEQS
jgi:hypothetical protein